MRNLQLLIILLFFLVACRAPMGIVSQTPDCWLKIESITGLMGCLEAITNEQDSLLRGKLVENLWKNLVAFQDIPFVRQDTVFLLYRGAAQEVSWAGDFNGWNPRELSFRGQLLPHTDLWIARVQFPPEARLDYKVVVDGNWMLDPANPHVQWSGHGPNSELRMSAWKPDTLTNPLPAAFSGTLLPLQRIASKGENLGYDVNYRVYLPIGYPAMHDSLPCIYVTDGHEYADERLGAMIQVLDQMMYAGLMEPIIAVFIDPRDPENLSHNRRMDEYRANIRFANFVADELVPHIDSHYRTRPQAMHRAIMGTSLGGWNAAFFGLKRYDTFGLLVIHSPAFDQEIIAQFQLEAQLPLKIYMSTGLIYDTHVRAQAMKAVWQAKGYPLRYRELHEGHSWGSWRQAIAEPLQYLFSPQ